jgi:hypothetical protein
MSTAKTAAGAKPGEQTALVHPLTEVQQLRAAVIDVESFAANGLQDAMALADMCRAWVERPSAPAAPAVLVRMLRLLATNAQETLDIIRDRAEDVEVKAAR